MVVLINDLEKDHSFYNLLDKEIKKCINDDIVEYSKENNESINCKGCFRCWFETPGICNLKDITNELNKKMSEADLIVIISKINYGTYSTYVKNILEKSLANLLPFFKGVGNRVQHINRYEKYSKFIVVGYGDEITNHEEELFKKVVENNAITFKADGQSTYIVRNKDDINKVCEDLKNIC